MFRRIHIIFFLVSMPFFLLTQILPEDFYQTPLDFELDRPIGLRFTPGGEGFIFGKSGLVWAIDSTGQLQEDIVLDIREEVTDWGDHGLVSLAVDPNFEANGFIYLYYVVDRHHLLHFGTTSYDPTLDIYNQASIGRVTKYKVEKNGNQWSAVIPSRQVLFGQNFEDGNPILMGSHGVGSLVFGGDGSLLLSCGDAGSYREADLGNADDTFHNQAIEDGIISEDENIGAFRSMLRGSLAGKLLRINPENGNGLKENPFYDSNNPRSHESRLWAYGFRNPYKFVYIENTSEHGSEGSFPGKFILGDVGSSFWEEVNLIDKPGEWFGWPKYEGLEGHWQFQSAFIPNPEAKNPLYENGCGEEYYFFKELIYQENENDEYDFNFPCDQLTPIPEEYPKYIHRRPILAYSNDQWNPPAKTFVPSFNDIGEAIHFSILDSLSSTDGKLIEGGSAIPGAFCNGDYFPEEYKGTLFLLDYRGWINVLSMDEKHNVQSIFEFAQLEEEGITDLSFHPLTGELYYTDFKKGQIFKIQYGGIRPPISKIEYDVNYGASPLTIQFNASKSQSFDESQLTYQWDFGDGEMGDEEVISHVYESENQEITNFQVQLMVSDTSGNTAINQVIVSLNNTPPEVDIISISDGDYYSISSTNLFPLKANVSDREHDENSLSYRWQAILHHDNHIHPGPVDENMESVAFIEPAGCGLEDFYYSIVLEVEDADGLRAQDSLAIFPYCGEDFSDIIQLELGNHTDGISVTWKDIIADDIEYYSVEHTQDFLFKEIARVQVNENDEYEYIHTGIENGPHFYRIKAINRSGIPDYSEVESINYVEKLLYRVFPNPVTQYLRFEVLHEQIDFLEFNITSINGSLITQVERHFDSSTQEFDQSIYLGDLPSGVYLYQLKVNELIRSGRILKL